MQDGIVTEYPHDLSEEDCHGCVYQTEGFREELDALPSEIEGEDPEPEPREQIENLLRRICAGEDIELGWDLEFRNGFALLKTRSVRAIGIFTDLNQFIAVSVRTKASLNPAKGGTSSTQWYKSQLETKNALGCNEYEKRKRNFEDP